MKSAVTHSTGLTAYFHLVSRLSDIEINIVVVDAVVGRGEVANVALSTRSLTGKASVYTSHA